MVQLVNKCIWFGMKIKKQNGNACVCLVGVKTLIPKSFQSVLSYKTHRNWNAMNVQMDKH